jgi:membrane-associated protein
MQMGYNIIVFNLETFIRTFSYIGVFSIIFAESGLLVGLVFPGDSLLFLAGGLASQHVMSIEGLIAVVLVAAIAGNAVGYWFGYKFGPGFFKRSKYLTPKELKKAETFFSKHGGKTVIIGRFVPVVRTLVPILAGIGDMSFPQFMAYRVIGALAWGVTISLLGFYVGSAIPNIDRYVLPVIVAVVAISLAPSVWHIWRRRNHPTPEES